MRKVAIIAAAGWKGSGVEEGLPYCPEPFLPLGDGTTTLSRSATMFAKHDFDVYIAVAEQGYRCSEYWDDLLPKESTEEFSMDSSPWTQARFDYASQFGTAVEVPNPGRTSANVTLCFVMDILKGQYDQLLLAQGDMLLSYDFFEKMMVGFSRSLTPSIYGFTPNHLYFFLDRLRVIVYRHLVEPWIGREFESRRDPEYRRMAAYMPSGHPQGMGVMGIAGTEIYGGHNWFNGEWMDIDTPEQYTRALQLVADGTFAWQGETPVKVCEKRCK